jgi:hypothetical protein
MQDKGLAMKKVQKEKSTLSPEERKKLIQETIEIGIRIMPKFKAAPNPHKK